MTGTGADAFAGVFSVAWISTLIAGYTELSTVPSNCFVTIGVSPFVPVVVETTAHVTFGVFGVRP